MELNHDKLKCYGCAHASAAADWPGSPSGERPCQFCVRNKDRPDIARAEWYDGSPAFKSPMDCYRSLDMSEQMFIWDKQTKVEARAATNEEQRNALEATVEPAYIPGLGTVRKCIDCKCLVAGGPTRCTRCADMAERKDIGEDLLDDMLEQKLCTLQTEMRELNDQTAKLELEQRQQKATLMILLENSEASLRRTTRDLEGAAMIIGAMMRSFDLYELTLSQSQLRDAPKPHEVWFEDSPVDGTKTIRVRQERADTKG